MKNYSFDKVEESVKKTFIEPFFIVLIGIFILCFAIIFLFNGKEYEVNTSGGVMAGDKSGGNCWCSMLRPATTYSMFVRAYDDVDSCSAGCARLCAESVIERFKNPYIKHYLSSIALNSVSKFKVRVLPSIEEFINIVKPKIALIGVGEDNKFGHPNDEVLERIQKYRDKSI